MLMEHKRSSGFVRSIDNSIKLQKCPESRDAFATGSSAAERLDRFCGGYQIVMLYISPLLQSHGCLIPLDAIHYVTC